jgi:ABC-type iron transport system FetAB ATPase subunit
MKLVSDEAIKTAANDVLIDAITSMIDEMNKRLVESSIMRLYVSTTTPPKAH